MAPISRLLSLAFVILGLATACGGEASDPGTVANTPSNAALPETYWLASAPPGAKEINALRDSQKSGDDVVVHGRATYFLDRRAQFQIVDTSFTPCDEREDDNCKTPWDYCCEDSTELAQGTLVVQFKDDKGLLKTGAKGFHALDHLKTVTVKGTLEIDDKGNMSLVASGIHVAP